MSKRVIAFVLVLGMVAGMAPSSYAWSQNAGEATPGQQEPVLPVGEEVSDSELDEARGQGGIQGAVISAGSAALSRAVDNYRHGRPLHKDVFQAALTGAAAGMLSGGRLFKPVFSAGYRSVRQVFDLWGTVRGVMSGVVGDIVGDCIGYDG